MNAVWKEQRSPLATLDEPREKETLRVCFICTGNTCRSPMAAAVANALAEGELAAYPAAVREALSPRLQATSRGLYAAEGEPIASNARRALEEAEFSPAPCEDYRFHTARNLTDAEAAQFDLLVAMSAGHAMELMMRHPEASSRIVCMPTPISDPYGGDLSVYRACLAEIAEGVKRLLFAERTSE